MHRFAVIVALCAVWCGARATAAPFDELSDRLQEYDQQQAPPRKRPQRDSYASYRKTSTDAEPAQEEAPAEQVWGEPESDGMADGACCEAGCDCQNCAPHGWWGRAEYLQWWVRGSNTPALVTTNPNNTPASVAGVLPNATVLFGDQRINSNSRPGGRFTLGYWLGNDGTLSVEDTFFFLGNSSQAFHGTSNGSPILARPFFDTLSGSEDAVLLAYPNTVAGSINVTSSSQILGNEINLRRALCMDAGYRLDMLAGYRFFYLNEGLRVDTNTTSIGGGVIPVGTNFGIFDSFAAQNSFNGGQLGLNSQYFHGRWTLDLLAKVALGAVTQRVTIDGQTVVTVPGQAPSSSSGGILALHSNIGQYNRNQFGVLPEFGVNLHYQISPRWQANLGYTFMLLSNVARPGDQIDRRLDPNQFPPPIAQGTSPQFTFHNSDIWLQGINVGLQCSF